MKLRSPPFIAELAALAETNPAEASRRRDAAMQELARSPGFQIVLSVLHDVERAALHDLRTGTGSAERALGRLAAVTAITDRLAALFPDGAPVELEAEEEYDMPVYDARPSFDIPYPTFGGMTADNV